MHRGFVICYVKRVQINTLSSGEILRSVDEDNVYVSNTATSIIIRIPWNFNDFLMTK